MTMLKSFTTYELCSTSPNAEMSSKKHSLLGCYTRENNIIVESRDLISEHTYRNTLEKREIIQEIEFNF